MRIDLNSDMGESFGVYTMGYDEQVMPFVTSINVACGFHPSDPGNMLHTVRLAKKHNVAVGAHPSFPDLVGFGRRNMAATPEEIKEATKPKFPQIEINGYKGEFNKFGIKFGCAQIKKEDILRLNDVMNNYHSGERDPDITYKNIESATIGKGTFSKSQIKEIAEYFINKDK